LSSPEKPRIGFIGLGVMGSRIAARLLAAGYAVTGFNRTVEKAADLVDRGMQLAPAPRQSAEGADVVFTMVSDADALFAVTTGPDGVLQGLRPGADFVDLSTVGPGASEELCALVGSQGGHFLAAPVSGSVSTIEAGQLSFMVGGDGHALETVRGVLEDIGSGGITYIGTPPQASAMKLALNLSVSVQVTAFCEGILLAERFGISREDAVNTFLKSVVASPMLAYRGRFLLDPPEEAWFTIALARKDLRLTLQMADSVRLPLFSAANVSQLLAAGEGMGFGGAELAAVADVLQAMSS